MTDTKTYLLVPPLIRRHCTGCVFEGPAVGCRAPDPLAMQCCRADGDEFVDVGIFIEDTDEAKVRYAAARLGVLT